MENLAALDPSRLSRSFPVAEVASSLVPYRTHRTVLGFDTSEDYEMAVLRFLAGEGGYAAVEPPEVQEAFAQEIMSINPDPGMFHRFGGAVVRLDPERVGEALSPEPADAAAARASAPEPAPGGPVAIAEPVFTAAPRDATAHAEPPPDEGPHLPFSLEDEPEDAPPAARPRAPMPGSDCPYCGGELPVGRAVMFCPHCGQNVGVVHCSTCGSELDVGWRFCITCGQKVSGGIG